MLQIRTATIQDVVLLLTMIRELAEFEHGLEMVTIREEDLSRDGFGENPRFYALIAEWDAEPAGYAFFFRELPWRRNVLACAGKYWIGTKGRLSCIRLWE